MSNVEKATILVMVETMVRRKRQALSELGIARSTYYRWSQEQRGQDLVPHSGEEIRPWNRITPEEDGKILAAAREFPELSSRQLATWITDNAGFAVSESTVYRILRREGLVKRLEVQLVAGKEYHAKTTRPHQMWATDASYFRVVGWGYYYLVTVMDDYSRFILAWKLQRDMSANSLIEVIQEAVDATGMTEVPVEDRTRLLSDNGAGYVCWGRMSIVDTKALTMPLPTRHSIFEHRLPVTGSPTWPATAAGYKRFQCTPLYPPSPPAGCGNGGGESIPA